MQIKKKTHVPLVLQFYYDTLTSLLTSHWMKETIMIREQGVLYL